jgi:hypothetical protein
LPTFNKTWFINFCANFFLVLFEEKLNKFSDQRNISRIFGIRPYRISGLTTGYPAVQSGIRPDTGYKKAGLSGRPDIRCIPSLYFCVHCTVPIYSIQKIYGKLWANQLSALLIHFWCYNTRNVRAPNAVKCQVFGSAKLNIGLKNGKVLALNNEALNLTAS